MSSKLVVGIILVSLLALAAAAPVDKEKPLADRQDMTTGGAITGMFATVILALCVLALLVALAALLPDLHQRSLAALERSPWRALGLGLVNYVFFGALLALFANLGPLGLVSLFIALALLALTGAGLAVVGRLVGERLAVWRESPTSPLTRLAAGTVILEMALFVPVVGWFVLLPLASLAGLGAVVLALVQRKPATSEI